MAIFASTTTSGYSDPLKAMSIKALEQRQKDMMAQMAQQQPDAAMMATIPGGIGHVLGQVGDRMQQSRTDQAMAARRAELAQVMSGIGPEGPNPQQIAQINSADPELARQMLTTLAENRRHAAQIAATTRGQDVSAGTAREGHGVTREGQQLTATTAREGHGVTQQIAQDRIAAEKAAATELARTQQDAAIAAEKRLQERPSTADVAQLKRALDRGEIDQATHDAAVKKLTAPAAGEQKILTEQKLASADAQTALGTLDEAEALLNSPKGIHTGRMAGTKTAVGQVIPERMFGPDDKTQENTQRYNQIMGGQALQALTQMKGASSDKDVAINFKIVNDPNETIDNKRRALGVLKTKLASYVQIHNEAITGAGGTAPKVEGAGGAADPLEGKTATDKSTGKQIIRRGGKWEPL